MTTLYIYDTGDRNTGIPPNEMDVNLNWDMSAIEPEERKALKNVFCRFAREWLDFGYPRVFAYFSDECPDCGKCYSRPDSRCQNKDCISYQPDEKIIIEESETDGDGKRNRPN